MNFFPIRVYKMSIVIRLTVCTLFLWSLVWVPLAFGWECAVTLSGPSAIKKEQTITLNASGDPSGGSYSWWRIPNLTPDGSTASLTAFEPTFSDYIRVGVNYTTPKGKKCSDIKYIWYEGCCAKISGPGTVQLGEAITLSASGEPVGGSFFWENSNPHAAQLDAVGDTAILTGLDYGSTTITLSYDNPESELHCKSFVEINVIDPCSIELFGTLITAVGDFCYLTAVTSPEGGVLTWTPHSNIELINDDYIYHGTNVPGTYTYEAKYTLSNGTSCSSTFDVTFVKVNSLSGPFCVDSGTTLSKSDFTLTTLPEGHNFLVNISPLTFVTDLPYFDETVNASIGSGLADDATTTIMVVNSGNKFNSGINVKVPNYVSEPLKTLGLSEKLNLSLNSKFDRFWECCSTFASSSVDGSTHIKLDVSSGPFTIIGIPLPKKIKNYATVDILNIGLSGDGGAKITGIYNGCIDNTEWSGGGSLSAKISANAEAKAIIPDVVVIHGKLSGTTEVTQNIKIDDTNLLVSSEWKGLKINGMVEIKTFKFNTTTVINHSLIKENEIPQISIPLPSFKINFL